MADLIIAFGIGVAAASFTHLRGPLWALLPTIGFLTATGASTCRRVSRALIKKGLENTSVVPSTPIELPRIKRPVASVISPVTQPPEASPCVSQCDCEIKEADTRPSILQTVVGLQEIQEINDAKSVVSERSRVSDDHCQNVAMNAELPKSPPKTPPKVRRLFEGKFDRNEFDVPDDYESVSRPPGIELELQHQGESPEPEPVARPAGIQLDLLVSGRRDAHESLNQDVLSQ